MEKRGVIIQIDSIHNAGMRAAKIVRNMLSFVKKDHSEKKRCRLDELIEQTVELARNDYDLKKNYDFKHIEVSCKFDPYPVFVCCEGSKIQQVLFNLIKNASETMRLEDNSGKNPRITIRLLRDRHMAEIEVADNGPGMDEKIKKRIFEPFFTTKNVENKGTGLGLSVSYFIIVDDHKGRLEVKSDPGKGSRFIIELPMDGG